MTPESVERRPLAVYTMNPLHGYLVSALGVPTIQIESFLDDLPERLVSTTKSTCSQAFLFHLCVSITARIPVARHEAIRALTENGVCVLNARAVDISKRAIHEANLRLGLPDTTAKPFGSAHDILIIKSNYNCGGLSEASLPKWYRQATGLNDIHPHFMTPDSYLVVRRCDVPSSWWAHPGLVIERFISNSNDLFYRAYVMGIRVVVSILQSADLLKRPVSGTPRSNQFFASNDFSPVKPHPDATNEFDASIVAKTVKTFCAEIGLDFGTLDLVRDDRGTFYIVDANTTPFWDDEQQPQILEFLSNGIDHAVRRFSCKGN